MPIHELHVDKGLITTANIMRRSPSSAFICLFCQNKPSQKLRPKTQKLLSSTPSTPPSRQHVRYMHSSPRARNASTSASPLLDDTNTFPPRKVDDPIPLHPLGPRLRPTTAPKPTIDIKHIARAPGLYSQNAIDRAYAHLRDNPFLIGDLVRRRAHLQQAARALRERNNEVKRQVEIAQIEAKQQGRKASADKGFQRLLAEAKELKGKLEGVRSEEDEIADGLEELALPLPALTSAHTPVGKDAIPEVLKTVIADKNSGNLRGTSHVEIGAELGILDFAAAAQATGWGWYYLVGAGALLEQALVQYTLGLLQERGWTLVAPPSITYAHIAAACGFQPRDQHGEQQIYSLASMEKPPPPGTQQSVKQREQALKKPSLVLTGTSEIPLAALHAGKSLSPTDLPLKTVAVSRCYRAEAGARGVDTKGLYRVHEFTKVEMFAWTLPNHTTSTSAASSTVDGYFAPDEPIRPQPSQADKNTPETPAEETFHEMLAIQERILTDLDLPYRILEMPSSDLGASASRKRDIEAFFPSRRHRDGGWGEVTSCSICDDYQTRRLGTKIKVDGSQSLKGMAEESWAAAFPFTVNGTALAAPRVIAAVLENGWDEATRRVRVPECLRALMGGVEFIEKGS